ncbi:MAG: Asp23/Gls24 family envelope stress response protein [Chloroflexi bacterium]|nr:Asp23/Gls24 family envelope stress response protein [Chloroflexota bacterium]
MSTTESEPHQEPVETEERMGAVRISPQVLATIARLTTLSVVGVSRMYRDISSDVNRFFKGKVATDGVRIEVVDNAVSVDIAVVAKPRTNLYDLGRRIQTDVSRAITEMVGMPVISVDVHIEEIESSAAEE